MSQLHILCTLQQTEFTSCSMMYRELDDETFILPGDLTFDNSAMYDAEEDYPRGNEGSDLLDDVNTLLNSTSNVEDLLLQKVQLQSTKKRPHTKNYSAAASKKSREKKRAELRNLKSRNTFLEAENNNLKAKVDRLNSQVGHLMKTRNNTEESWGRKRLKLNNVALKSELQSYRRMANHIKSILNSFTHFDSMTRIYNTRVRNCEYMMERFFQLAYKSADLPVIHVEKEKATFFNGVNNNLLEYVINPEQRSRVRNQMKAPAIDFAQLHKEVRCFGNAETKECFFRLDIFDIPIPRAIFVEIWSIVDNHKWMVQVMKRALRNKKYAKYIKPSNFKGLNTFLSLKIDEVKKDAESMDDYGLCQSTKLVKLTSISKNGAFLGNHSMILSVAHTCSIGPEYFPSHTISQKSEANVKVQAGLPEDVSDVLKYQKSGRSYFRSNIFREGSSTKTTHYSFLLHLCSEKDDDSSFIDSSKRTFSPNGMFARIEALIKCCIFIYQARSENHYHKH